MYLFAEVAVGFASSYGEAWLKQKIDRKDGPFEWEKALENGVKSAISAAPPKLGDILSKYKSGNYARDFQCFQTFRPENIYSFC